MTDIDTMHYAVAKALSEVRAHRCHIKELEDLIQHMLDTGCPYHDEVPTKLSELRQKYSHEETKPCSDSSPYPPKT